MVIVQLTGGLGNQLFQYAAGRCLATRLKRPLVLDTGSYAAQQHRAFRLDHFSIRATPASRSQLVSFTSLRPLARARRLVERRLPIPFRRVVNASTGVGLDKIGMLGQDIYLVGHWSGERYFKAVASALRDELQLRPDHPSKQNGDFAALKAQISREQSVFVHIRRGDYCTDPWSRDFFGTLPVAYYERALEHVRVRVPTPKWIVFSDDLGWVKDNLPLPADAVFPADQLQLSDVEQFDLMRSCAHGILANSTYSWWAAWLMRRPDLNSNIVAPAKWYRNQQAQMEFERNDFIPSSWALI